MSKIVRTTKQMTEADPAGWEWVEKCVWTDRMLKTLKEGVKGGKWYSLMDKVCKEANLEEAHRQVKKNKGSAGVDKVNLERYSQELVHNQKTLHEELSKGTYEPKPILRQYIDKPGTKKKRPLGIPAVRDRIAQTALRNVIEPIYENDFEQCSYGFRPGRGCKDALRRVEELLETGHKHIVDADITGFFDNLDKEILMDEIRKKISDGRVLDMIQAYLNQDVVHGMENWTPEKGTPQGAVISPLLANIYLDPFDKEMTTKGFQLVRYADDFVILCKDKEEAEEALKAVTQWMQSHKLELHPEKTDTADMNKPENSFEFLGYKFKNPQAEKRWETLTAETYFR